MAENNDLNPEQGAGAVESVVLALHKVIDLLDRIKSAIEESSNKIPKASVQLNTVTQATELATVEILNVLDTMTQKVTDIENQIPVLEALVPSDKERSVVEFMKNNLADVKQDTMNISIALQVQDITAQKIAAANHLIECVRVELMRELNYFEHAGVESLERKPLVHAPGPVASIAVPFDKNASYEKSTEHQARINKLMKEWKEKQAAELA